MQVLAVLGVCAAFGGGCGRAAFNAPSNHLLPLATAGMLLIFLRVHVALFGKL